MISITELYNLFIQYPCICTDTRNIEKNCLFFCLKGENFNGNTFALQAIHQGSAYVIVDEKEYVIHEKCILVSDSLKTLQDLALHHRKQLTIPIIGITGTNGKTTTKELINAVLSSSYNVIATKGNLNNHIGVPLTVLSINKDVRIAIIEMGANHAHEIEFLCKIALPTLGIITNIGKAHLEGFHTIETIIETKTALYKAVKEAHGTVFVNSDDTLLMCHASDLKQITYGKNPSADFIGEIMDNTLSCNVYLPACKETISTQLIGNYNFYNIMAAIAVGSFFNVTYKNIQTALASYIPSNSRSQILTKATNTLIMDAYNANPSSMELALRNFAEIKNNHKVVILGDMRELGEVSMQEHQAIVHLIIELQLKEVYLIGHEFATVNHFNFHSFENFEEASKKIAQANIQHSMILIKGSRGMKMERMVDYL